MALSRSASASTTTQSLGTRAPMALSLSDYYDVSCYAGASLALYSVTNIAVRTGCVRGDGMVKRALLNVSGLMLQRAFWAAVLGRRVDWLSEACYWVAAFIVSIIVAALDTCLEAVIRRWEERMLVVPQPVPRRGRGGRRPLV